MNFKMRRTAVGISFVTGLVLNCALALDVSAQRPDTGAFNRYGFCENQLQGEVFVRTELFFGLSRQDGPDVTEEEFQHFIDDKVTPRFPDGLTLLTGTGQFRDANGATAKEGSKLLILLYPFDSESNRKIREIQDEYINAFQQQSVLRADERSCVSF